MLCNHSHQKQGKLASLKAVQSNIQNVTQTENQTNSISNVPFNSSSLSQSGEALRLNHFENDEIIRDQSLKILGPAKEAPGAGGFVLASESEPTGTALDSMNSSLLDATDNEKLELVRLPAPLRPNDARPHSPTGEGNCQTSSSFQGGDLDSSLALEPIK